MKLKTLKDIFLNYYEDLPSENLKNELKIEAVKWYKESKETGWKAFKHFFNLDEDLK